MNTIYILIESWGEYEDHTENVIAWSPDKTSLEAAATRLSAAQPKLSYGGGSNFCVCEVPAISEEIIKQYLP